MQHSEVERVGLPRSEQAEGQLLGVFIRYGHLLRVSKLDKDDFYSERNRAVFEAMQGLSTEGSTVDIMTIAERMRRDSTLHLADGEAGLMEMADGIVSSAGWEAWEGIVLQKSMLRAGIQAARDLNARAFSDDQSPDEIVAALAAAATVLSRRLSSRAVTTWQQAYHGAVKRDRIGLRVMTGIDWLDEMLTVLPGQLGIIAGRPGDGKSAMATQMLVQIARNDETLLCTLEMSPEEVAQRMVSQMTGIPLWRLDEMDLTADETRKVRECEAALDANFCAAGTVQELRAIALTRKAQGRLKMIVVDYLQLMKVNKPSGSRNEDVSSISRDLKLLAGELQVPVIALSQFSRDAAKGAPEVHHLRDSGAIEQDADWILFVYSDRSSGQESKMIRLAKQRRGPTFNPFAVEFIGQTVTFGGRTV